MGRNLVYSTEFNGEYRKKRKYREKDLFSRDGFFKKEDANRHGNEDVKTVYDEYERYRAA